MSLVKRTDLRYHAEVTDFSGQQFAVELACIAHDSKSDDVIALDLRGISQVMDFVVIATGRSQRQMRGLADAVIEYGKKVNQKPYGFAGYETSAWIVIDYVDVVFHLFGKPYRDFYDLELLWGDAPRIPWAKSESA